MPQPPHLWIALAPRPLPRRRLPPAYRTTFGIVRAELSRPGFANRIVDNPALIADAAPVIKHKEKWYSDGLRFTCRQCGNCCSGDPGYVWATKEEIARIARHLGGANGWLDKKHLRRVGFKYSLTEKPNGDCIFLQRTKDGKTGCAIYPVRPRQCRTWPFWPELLRSRAAWERATHKCPGMNTGRHYDFVAIEQIRRRKA